MINHWFQDLFEDDSGDYTMRRLFANHWTNHDELLQRLSRKPQAYLALSYWVGRGRGAPVFFITQAEEPDTENDPRFMTWEPKTWVRLGQPAEAEGILSEYLHATIPEGATVVPVDVHWHIQFPA